MRRWEDNIKIDLREGVNWIHLAQNREHMWAFLDTAIVLPVP
jgi:hypothetical protein